MTPQGRRYARKMGEWIDQRKQELFGGTGCLVFLSPRQGGVEGKREGNERGVVAETFFSPGISLAVEGEKIPPTSVWTSSLRRTVETAECAGFYDKTSEYCVSNWKGADSVFPRIHVVVALLTCAFCRPPTQSWMRSMLGTLRG